MSKQIKCAQCGAVYWKTQKKCPECGKMDSKSAAQITIGIFILIFGIIVLTIGLSSMLSPAIKNTNAIVQGTAADVINSPATISLAESNQITTGMTYQQVCAIVGGEGTLGSTVDIGEAAYKTELYEWTGDGVIGANANVTFQGGKMVSKVQVGLK